MTSSQPVAPQAHSQQQRPILVVAHCPAKRGPQVVDPGRPLRVLVECQFKKMPAVCGLQRLDLCSGDEPLPRKLPNSLK
jgi:hypothetical protein